jgi:DNA-binding NtrC family response regulator
MKILVVDRELSLGRLYEDELSEEGHKVIFLSTGDQVLKSIAAKKPKLVILGVRIPGYETEPFKLLDQIKASFPKLPVIFSTSLSELWPEAQFRGADFCHYKSSDLTELKEMIEKVKNKKK